MTESSSGTEILEISGLAKSFGPVKVLADVSFSLHPGTILGLAGENGAGKSTLAKCISGQHRPSAGTIRVNGPCYVIPQEFSLIPTLKVYENIFLGRELSRFGLLRKKEMIRRSAELLAMIDPEIDPCAETAFLGVAEKQKIEIAKAFLHDTKLLIMDEPTTVLNRTETETLFRIMRDFRARGGAIIYISHKLEEVRTICDRIVVLRDGVLVADEKTSEVSAMDIARQMVGRSLQRVFPPKEAVPDSASEVLRCENLSAGSAVRHVSFTLRRGEILGFAGLAGAGRTELAETICGFRKRTGGRLFLNGKPVVWKSPHAAKKAGLSYLPEDRQRTAILPDFSVTDNITIGSLEKYGKAGFVRKKLCREAAERYIGRFRIRTENPETKLRNLSGGNQQKAVIAKGLDSDPQIFIFDEPTRGVDVGARGEIYEFIHELAHSGVSCILISSDLEEIIGNCTRTLVMRKGSLQGELRDDRITEEEIMFLATGVK